MAATNNTDCYTFCVHMILRVEVAVMFRFEYRTVGVVNPFYTFLLLLLFCLTVMVFLFLFVLLTVLFWV